MTPRRILDKTAPPRKRVRTSTDDTDGTYVDEDEVDGRQVVMAQIAHIAERVYDKKAALLATEEKHIKAKDALIEKENRTHAEQIKQKNESLDKELKLTIEQTQYLLKLNALLDRVAEMGLVPRTASDATNFDPARLHQQITDQLQTRLQPQQSSHMSLTEELYNNDFQTPLAFQTNSGGYYQQQLGTSQTYGQHQLGGQPSFGAPPVNMLSSAAYTMSDADMDMGGGQPGGGWHRNGHPVGFLSSFGARS